MHSAILQAINGISLAALLFLLASGFTLTFGLMRVVNMAHGAYYLLGGYIGYSITRPTGSFALGVAGGGLAIIPLGFLIDRFLIRRTGENHLAQVLLTVGIAFVIGDLALKLSEERARELEIRNNMEQERLQIASQSNEAQLMAESSRVEQLRALHMLRVSQVEGLQVRPGIRGVLQQVPVAVGQQVTPGVNLARVAQPEHLKAELRIAETQAKDVEISQRASIDTRNGIVEGRVMRIDPAVQDGTVTVDVELVGELPRGARPDLSVDGTIEIERLEDVLYVGRPAYGQAGTTVSLFRLLSDGQTAERVDVTLGKSSVNTIEIVAGLGEGDEVILSDTSAWDDYRKIRLN